MKGTYKKYLLNKNNTYIHIYIYIHLYRCIYIYVGVSILYPTPNNMKKTARGNPSKYVLHSETYLFTSKQNRRENIVSMVQNFSVWSVERPKQDKKAILLNISGIFSLGYGQRILKPYCTTIITPGSHPSLLALYTSNTLNLNIQHTPSITIPLWYNQSLYKT